MHANLHVELPIGTRSMEQDWFALYAINAIDFIRNKARQVVVNVLPGFIQGNVWYLVMHEPHKKGGID